MQGMKYRLAALDMDGTLLNSEHQISDGTRDVIARAAEAGGVIALCTGRCLSELRSHLRALPGVAYAICENGGCLYDAKEARILEQICLPDGEAARILRLASRYDVCVQSFFDSQSHMQLSDAEELRRFHIYDFAGVFREGSIFVPDMAAVWPGRGMEKINLYFASGAERLDFRRELGETQLHLADSLGIGYEISPRRATKALGLAALCRRLDVPLSQTLAVGDGGNDLELMRSAGFSVAMGNATEAVRRAAHAVTADCDHEGAARAVARYMLGEEG